MDKLAQMSVFAAVVESGSFTGAADELGIAKSTVSRRIRELEERLGVRLLTRTTRVTRPTDAGKTYYERCAQILDDAREADQAVMDAQSSPRGHLRITVAAPFARRYLMKPLSELLSAHPHLRAELILDERLLNIVEDAIDVAIRIAHPKSSGLVARKLGTSETIVCASPDYLARAGRPEHPDDLVDHSCLSRTGVPWLLRGDSGEDTPVEVTTRLESGEGGPLLQAAIHGTGVLCAPDFMVKDALVAGELEPVLRAYWPSARQVYALFLQRRLVSPRVRVLVDHLVQAYADPPWRITT